MWSLLLYFKYIDGKSSGHINYEHKSPRWMDVEGFICDILNRSRIPSLINESFQERTHYARSIGKIEGASFEMQVHEIKSLAQTKKRDFGVKNAFDLLFGDLSQFEEDFMNYLGNLKMADYFARSCTLMSKMTNDFQNTYVISFNYTKLPAGLKGENQVHGNLEERNIIIGVDKSTIQNKIPEIMRFTKSWRQLSEVLNVSKLPAREDVTEIVVFGHSLGNQDYSYFHSIFNYYDIYSSNVKLSFLYADYHVDKETGLRDTLKDEEHRLAYIDSVYSLLNDYVEKSLGQKEADSFVTKIQLEGRLLVEEINEHWVDNR